MSITCYGVKPQTCNLTLPSQLFKMEILNNCRSALHSQKLSSLVYMITDLSAELKKLKIKF